MVLMVWNTLELPELNFCLGIAKAEESADMRDALQFAENYVNAEKQVKADKVVTPAEKRQLAILDRILTRYEERAAASTVVVKDIQAAITAKQAAVPKAA